MAMGQPQHFGARPGDLPQERGWGETQTKGKARALQDLTTKVVLLGTCLLSSCVRSETTSLPHQILAYTLRFSAVGFEEVGRKNCFS